MDSNYKLYFYSEGVLKRKIAIKKGNKQFNIIIGSDDKADIKLENKLVSRNHLQLIYDISGKLHVQDLGSKNGTSLNGVLLKSGDSKQLKISDRIQIAGHRGLLIKIEKYSKESISETSSNIIEKLKSKKVVTIGRGEDCDIVLHSSTVSRHHAAIRCSSKGYYVIQDLNSVNGIYINGKKVRNSARINKNDRIYIGKHQLSLIGKTKDLADEFAIRAQGIGKTYKGKRGKKIEALKRLDLNIPAKDLVAIMGPSGCGKSTLLKSLNGDTLPTKGKVFLFGQELVENYEYLKTKIGYVPQDDILHFELTVEQCLRYTARLRLDLTSEEIDKKIDQVLLELDMYDFKKSRVSALSGGQRKRASIAMELLTDPLILFLDEPTSPLDPQTIKKFLEILQRLAKKGTTVVMVTHKPEDLFFMNSVIFLSEGGHMVYDDQAKISQIKKYFESDNIVGVFSKLGKKDPHKNKIEKECRDYWINKFNFEKTPKNIQSSANKVAPSRVALIPQYFWLSMRYFKIKTNDTSNTLWMLVQAPIIAILICFIFDEITSAVLFIVAVSAIWLGSNNAAREIVSEKSIYKRERMFNLKIFPYIFSKISVLSFFTIIQSLIFTVIIFIRYEIGDQIVDLNTPFYFFLWMVFLSLSATFLGLLISSIFKTSEKVMTIVPIILIPQIMLAGLVTSITNAFVEVISYFTLSRWGTEGFHAIQERIAVENPPSMIPQIEGESCYNCIVAAENTDLYFSTSLHALDQLHSRFYDFYRDFDAAGDLLLNFFVLLMMTILMCLFTFIALKLKDTV